VSELPSRGRPRVKPDVPDESTVLTMTTIDLAFPVRGTSVPVDHGYPLYAALSNLVPEIHAVAWLGVHPISGRRQHPDRLRLGPRGELRLRLPAEKIPTVLPLAGTRPRVDDAFLTLGAPSVHPLVGAPSLDARLVVVKLTDVPKSDDGAISRELFAERYRQELARQMERLGVRGSLSLEGRRGLSVKGKRVIGFSVRVSDLSDADSVTLQANGLGGKRAMGCGIFRPTRGKRT